MFLLLTTNFMKEKKQIYQVQPISYRILYFDMK